MSEPDAPATQTDSEAEPAEPNPDQTEIELPQDEGDDAADDQ